MNGNTGASLPVVRPCDLEGLCPERRWLVDRLWARAGVGIIGGSPKLGKSWLGLDLAVSVASATPCLDTFAVQEPGPPVEGGGSGPRRQGPPQGPVPAPRPRPFRLAHPRHHRSHPAPGPRRR